MMTFFFICSVRREASFFGLLVVLTLTGRNSPLLLLCLLFFAS